MMFDFTTGTTHYIGIDSRLPVKAAIAVGKNHNGLGSGLGRGNLKNPPKLNYQT